MSSIRTVTWSSNLPTPTEMRVSDSGNFRISRWIGFRANRPLNPISPVANPCCNHVFQRSPGLREGNATPRFHQSDHRSSDRRGGRYNATTAPCVRGNVVQTPPDRLSGRWVQGGGRAIFWWISTRDARARLRGGPRLWFRSALCRRCLSRIPRLTEGLIPLKPDVFVSGTMAGVIASKKLTNTRPIVSVVLTD